MSCLRFTTLGVCQMVMPTLPGRRSCEIWRRLGWATLQDEGSVECWQTSCGYLSKMVSFQVSVLEKEYWVLHGCDEGIKGNWSIGLRDISFCVLVCGKTKDGHGNVSRTTSWNVVILLFQLLLILQDCLLTSKSARVGTWISGKCNLHEN